MQSSLNNSPNRTPGDPAADTSQLIYPENDPPFWQMTAPTIREFITETDEKIQFAKEHGAQELFIIGLGDQRSRAAAELARRNGHRPAPIATDDPIAATLQGCGLAELESGASITTVEEAIRNLQLMVFDADDIRRATIREAVLKKLAAIGISAPARLIDAAIEKPRIDKDDTLQGKRLLLREILPDDNAVNGGQLLIDLCQAIRRYIVADTADVVATVLWAVHAYAIDAFPISPFLNFSSPEKGCGKSTALTVLSFLLPRTVFSGNMSPSTIFRAIELYKPSFLIDEADTFESINEELRGLLNASHLRASAQVIRSVASGEDHEPRLFSTWCPKAIALIGRLPDTLDDRSVVINMRRRKRTETCERFSAIDLHPELEELGRRIARWTKDSFDLLRQARPEAEGIDLRLYDNWMPLLAVADVAGGEWPRWARIAAGHFVAKGAEPTSIRVELLLDAVAVSGDDDRVSSEQLVDGLNGMADRPWPTFSRGKPMTQLQLARMLKPFEIRPANLRIDGRVIKGYHRDELVAALERYSPPKIPLQPLQKKLAREITELETIFVADEPATGKEPILEEPLQGGDSDGFDWETGEQADGFEDVPK